MDTRSKKRKERNWVLSQILNSTRLASADGWPTPQNTKFLLNPQINTVFRGLLPKIYLEQFKAQWRFAITWFFSNLSPFFVASGSYPKSGGYCFSNLRSSSRVLDLKKLRVVLDNVEQYAVDVRPQTGVDFLLLLQSVFHLNRNICNRKTTGLILLIHIIICQKRRRWQKE